MRAETEQIAEPATRDDEPIGPDAGRPAPADDAAAGGRRSPSTVDTTQVEIYGSVYNVRGRDDRGYLQEVAALVDGKMREVAGQTAAVDTAKIAILAALNLADELLQSRKTEEGERVEIRRRVAALSGELSAALGH